MENQSQLAFAYLRVSGKGQVDGDGFPRQLAAIEAYAKAHNLVLVKVFREEGVSGTKELENRPALLQLLAAANNGKASVVLVEKLDRLARDLMVQETILRDLQRRGITLVSTLAGARQRMRAKTGVCEGRKPYGAHKGERRIIDRILALRETGAAMDTIADTLNGEGLKPRSGRQWYGSSVRNVLLRQSVTPATSAVMA